LSVFNINSSTAHANEISLLFGYNGTRDVLLRSHYVALTSKSTQTEQIGLDSSRGASSYGSVCVRNEAANQRIGQ